MSAAAELVAGAQAVVFDLDGTLADTAMDLWAALVETLRSRGLPEVAMPLVLRSLHGGLEATARAALAELKATEVAPDAFSEAYALAYGRRDHRATRLYEDAALLLGDLALRGIPVGVCTNKAEADAMTLLRRLEVARHVRCVTGIDTTGFAKPAPEPLLHTLARLGCGPGHAVFIGDSQVDADCAAAAGVPFVLHAGGFGAGSVKGAPGFQAYAQLLSASGHRTAQG